MTILSCLFAILFVLSAFLIFYTYVVFPAILSWLSGKQGPVAPQIVKEFFPVTVIMSAYNEEAVIGEKLLTIVNSDYPVDKLEIIVGSDSSNDRTDEIVRKLGETYPNVKLHSYSQRRGKPAVVNDLVSESSHPIIVMTDANVLFEKDMLKKLVAPFSNDKVGLVGANILNIGLKKDGISVQEKSYIQRENVIKYREGKLWGCMMGPFGGCYALRKNLFVNVPQGFLVDDFYISMRVMEKGFSCVNQLDAICYEDVSNDIKQEYKRKSRISAGNYQNLMEFSGFLLRPFTPVGFCFISHKFLRWITPFLILLSVLSLAVLSASGKIFFILLLLELIMLATPFIDAILSRMNIHMKLLRFISYFSYMNLALIRGFFNYATGVKSSVWQPTKRN